MMMPTRLSCSRGGGEGVYVALGSTSMPVLVVMTVSTTTEPEMVRVVKYPSPVEGVVESVTEPVLRSMLEDEEVSISRDVVIGPLLPEPWFIVSVDRVVVVSSELVCVEEVGSECWDDFCVSGGVGAGVGAGVDVDADVVVGVNNTLVTMTMVDESPKPNSQRIGDRGLPGPVVPVANRSVVVTV
jgi:hypothetical protein